MSFMDLLKARYSCRCFSNKIVEDEKILKILEAARFAPTAKNVQPLKIYEIKSQKALETLRSVTRMAYNAPLAFIIAYNKLESYKAYSYNDEHDCGDIDASIVATHMMFEAKELGLETLWARGFNAIELARAFDLPENMQVSVLLDVGYADSVNGGESPRHTVRKSLEELVIEL